MASAPTKALRTMINSRLAFAAEVVPIRVATIKFKCVCAKLEPQILFGERRVRIRLSRIQVLREARLVREFAHGS